MAGRGRGNQVGDCLGLAQVHLAVHEGALRIFAGEGGAATAFNQKLHDLLLDVDGTVAGDLYRVFAGKGMRCAEKSDQHLINEFFTTPDTTVTQCIGFL